MIIEVIITVKMALIFFTTLTLLFPDHIWLLHLQSPYNHQKYDLKMSYVTIETSVGSLTVELYTEHAPKVGLQLASDSAKTHPVRPCNHRLARTFQNWRNVVITTM